MEHTHLGGYYICPQEVPRQVALARNGSYLNINILKTKRKNLAVLCLPSTQLSSSNSIFETAFHFSRPAKRSFFVPAEVDACIQHETAPWVTTLSLPVILCVSVHWFYSLESVAGFHTQHPLALPVQWIPSRCLVENETCCKVWHFLQEGTLTIQLY